MLSYNEILGLQTVLPRIQKNWVDEIIIVDGGSTDGSIEYAESMGFFVLRQKRLPEDSTAWGSGIVEGYRQGLARATGDYIINFTPDNNCIPEVIPRLVAKIKEGYDMVIASRYLGDAKSQDDTFVTAFGNWFFTTLVNVLFRSHYTDVLGFYRAYRKNLTQELGIDIRLSVSTQQCIRCKKKNIRVTEIPADEPSHIGGKSSRSILKNGFIELKTIFEEFFSGS